MKKVLLSSLITLSIFATVLMTSCKKVVKGCKDNNATNYNSNATEEDGSCKYNGKVVFWIAENAGTNITVNISGQIGIINSYYAAFDPTCESAGCATFTLPAGDYTFNASNGVYTWNGNVTVPDNDCHKLLLDF